MVVIYLIWFLWLFQVVPRWRTDIFVHELRLGLPLNHFVHVQANWPLQMAQTVITFDFPLIVNDADLRSCIEGAADDFSRLDHHVDPIILFFMGLSYRISFAAVDGLQVCAHVLSLPRV